MEDTTEQQVEISLGWIGFPPKSDEPEADWIEVACREIDAACELVPPIQPGLDQASIPEWVQRLEAEIARSYFPSAFRGTSKGLSPGRFGYALGRQIALFEWYVGFLVRMGLRLRGKVIITPEMQERGERWSRQMEASVPHYRRAANRTLLRAAGANPPDRAAFFNGFSEGLLSGRGSSDSFPGTAETTASDIYQVMFLCWPSVAKFDSVRQLHGFLVRVLGANRVGVQKRIEKVCQRIGLTFRPPGRPAKRNTDN